MTEKILVLSRELNALWIYDACDNIRDCSLIYNITHIAKGKERTYFLYNQKRLVGFIANVKEVKERW